MYAPVSLHLEECLSAVEDFLILFAVSLGGTQCPRSISVGGVSFDNSNTEMDGFMRLVLGGLAALGAELADLLFEIRLFGTPILWCLVCHCRLQVKPSSFEEDEVAGKKALYFSFTRPGWVQSCVLRQLVLLTPGPVFSVSPIQFCSFSIHILYPPLCLFRFFRG